MIEKESESFSDIVDCAMGELRSSSPSPEMPPKLFNALLQAAKENKSENAPALFDAKTTHPTFPTRSLNTWKWIMRSPVSRVAAAVIFVLAIGGVAVWLHEGGTTPVYADFVKPLLEAKTVKYKQTVTWLSLSAEQKGLSAEMQKNLLKGLTSEVMMLGPSLMRTESEELDKSKTVFIWDGNQGKSINLIPAQKRATVSNDAHKHEGKTSNGGDPVAGWRSLLLDAKGKPDGKREPLGEKDIDGRRVVGFRIISPTSMFSIWGDLKTGLPALIEMTSPLMPDVKFTISDFEFNVDMDESLFSVEPPAGYKVTSVKSPKTDESPAGEENLIETFRYYGELSGGTFPDLLDRDTLIDMVYGGLWLFYSLDRSPTSREKHREEHYAAQEKFDRGLNFAVLLPKESNSYYAGKDVSLGASDTPVFWYRPKDAKKYRVIYADLSVREAETPPSVPVVQPGQPEKNLIEMLRMYSEWSGGALPNALDRTKIIVVFMKNTLAEGSDKQKRSSEQWKKIAGAHFKFLRGMKFISLLPKETGWRYTGNRNSVGAVNTPIFWYRPKDAKTYRVVYADLTVHEADTPPGVPDVLPEQDLIDTFREYDKLVGGGLPDSLDSMKIWERYSKRFVTELFLEMSTPVNGKPDEEKRRKIEELLQNLTLLQEHNPEKGKPDKEQMAKLEEQSHKIDEKLDKLVDWGKVAPGEKNLGIKQKNHYKDAYTQKFMQPYVVKITKAAMRAQPGLTFVSKLPPDADAHYAGKGVKFGTPDRPIFWYHPKDSKKYRVIYADLSVRDADTPPNVPNAQPVQDVAKPKK